MKRFLLRAPIFGSVILYLIRLRIAFGAFISVAATIVRWLFKSSEHTNFTYPLTDMNIDDLADTLSFVTGTSSADISEYIAEIQSDVALRDYLSSVSKSLPAYRGADREIHYGRRVGWYAIIRAMKPALVVESGIDKGLGTCVIAAALKMNESDGISGSVVAIDINPEAGDLVGGEYSKFVKNVTSDSISAIEQLDGEIDLFIHDSDHSTEYEAAEYVAVREKLSTNGIVLSDNAHVSSVLRGFARREGFRYLYWQERPSNHFYSGSGIGAAFTVQPNGD